MRSTIRHRGPDDQGAYEDDSATLLHERLSIIDLAGGRQPMSDESGRRHVIFNGEIYNYRELRGELIAQGHRFRTQSDTEVIVHLYEQMGERCPEKLIGMFAFAIWDSVERTLFLARDRLGIKPLFYAELPPLRRRGAGRAVPLRLGAQGDPGARRRRARARPRRARPVPDVHVRPRAADDRARRAQAAAGPHAHPPRRTLRRPAVLGTAARRAGPRGPAVPGRGRGAARAARGGRPLPPDQRRAAGRLSLRRTRQQPGGRAHVAWRPRRR